VTAALTGLSVVLPARNEAGRLGDCLNAIGAAITVYAATPGSLPVDVVIALDSCTDDSVAVIARHPGTRNVQVREGSAGRARNAGVLSARTVRGTSPGRRHWVAMTDADTRVPPHWLAAQVRLAEEGADVVVGTVEPDPDEHDHLTLGHWRSRHDLREDHPHVHGANLGFTLEAYDRVGGFPGVPLHEDVEFVRRARTLGLRVRATDLHRVTTSARRTGRTPGGFAAYLRELDPAGSTTGGSTDQGKSIQRSVRRQT
jgi:glycosyltransferase involved in cell wall biosynthesis